jgi:hypothetical protein
MQGELFWPGAIHLSILFSVRTTRIARDNGTIVSDVIYRAISKRDGPGSMPRGLLAALSDVTNIAYLYYFIKQYEHFKCQLILPYYLIIMPIY